MVTYTLDNIEGIVFQHRDTIYKIHKTLNKMEYLNKPNYKNNFFKYDIWNTCINNINKGIYKVIETNNIIELW
jgi:hypothetical protein